MTNPYQTPESAVDRGGMIPCIGCGKQLHSTAAMCPNCGASQRSKRYKSKTVAAVLALLLGGLGVHRFYLGQWWGIFYLLFFWLWIPGLIAFVEFIVFLVTDAKKWDDKYNEGRPAGPGERSGTGLILAISIGALGFIMLLGILAAVAIPAYHDYSMRAKVDEALRGVAPVRVRVEEFVSRNRMLPDSNIMLGLDEPHIIPPGHSVEVTEAGITLILADDSETIDGKTVVFALQDLQGEWRWDCTGGSLEPKFRPQVCRQ